MRARTQRTLVLWGKRCAHCGRNVASREKRLLLARTCRVSTLQKIETGPVVEPGYFTVLALCRALDVDLRHLDEAYRTLRDSSDST